MWPGMCLLLAAVSRADSPYPPSPVIKRVAFDFETHKRRAPGSDNWAITWVGDDHQYAAWGDGGGFGGTNGDGRVSLGVARIEGPADKYRGVNVWGGKEAQNAAKFGLARRANAQTRDLSVIPRLCVGLVNNPG